MTLLGYGASHWKIVGLTYPREMVGYGASLMKIVGVDWISLQ